MDREEEEALELEYNVLIVEANRRRANNLKYILDGLYFTDVVRSVEEAVSHITHKKVPDLIISSSEFTIAESYLVPSSNTLEGVDLCKYISKNSKSSINSIPVVILMDRDDSKLKAKLFHSGAADVLAPDFDMLDLFSRLEKHLENVSEKRKLFDSIQDLLDDKRVRNRKNVDFRTKLFAKHRESISLYEERIGKLREQIAEKNSELESAKLYIQDLKRENIELFNELRYIKSNLSPESGDKSGSGNDENSLDNLSESEFSIVEDLFKHVNKEHLFEENIVKIIADKILENELDFRKIDNFYFINNIPRILRQYIKYQLEEIYTTATIGDYKKKCKEYMDLLVEFIMKAYTNKFLFFFAMNLLEIIANKDENATKFLKFYDGRVEIAPDGRRFQKPTISGDKEGAWNMISMMQIINQRANGHKAIVEQEENLRRVNTEFDTIKRSFDMVMTSENGLMVEELKKQRPFKEKLNIMEDVLRDERDNLSPVKDVDRLMQIDEKLRQLNIIRENYEKNSSAKDILMSKYSKQISYYKPTEEKFTKVALSVAKVLLKVKIITS